MIVANGSDLYQVIGNFVVDEIISHRKSQNPGDWQFVASKTHLRKKKQICLESVQIVEEAESRGRASIFQVLRFRLDIGSGASRKANSFQAAAPLTTFAASLMTSSRSYASPFAISRRAFAISSTSRPSAAR